MTIPHWAPPTHAMQIFRYAEQGSINFLWISATNPAVSMPELPRIRDILAKPDLFLVVQDLYLTETAQYADVVLPAAAWGEKTGTFTNVNRVVHLSDKAVDPPGEARSDLDIFLDYSRRMEFTTLAGAPLLDWTGPEDAFEAWKNCSRGRPCDYTGISYDRLRGGSGIPWPCNEDHPDGTDRLYGDGVFPTDPDYCESYGHDLLTGATVGGPGLPRPGPRRPGPVQDAPRSILRTRSPTRTTRSGTRPAAPRTTSTPAPKQAAPGPSRMRHRGPGWSWRGRTRTGSESPKATWSG